MVAARYGMGMTFHVTIDNDQLNRLERDFRHVPKAVPRIIRNSINRTLTSVRAHVARVIKGQVPKLKVSEIKSKIPTKKATMNRGEGLLLLSPRRYTLMRFAYRQNKKNKRGVPFMVYKSTGRLWARHAFFIPGRKPPFVRSLAGGGKPGERLVDIKTGRLAGEGGEMVPRGPLDVLIGPELADVFRDNPAMIGPIEAFINTTFTKNLNAYIKHELEKILKK